MFCTKCGKNNSPNDRYCSNCGSLLGRQVKGDNNQKNTWIVVVLSALIAFLIVVAVCMLVYNYLIPPKRETDVKKNDNQPITLQQPESEDVYIDNGTYEIDVEGKYEIDTKQLDISPERQTKKDEYLRRAGEIDQYSKDHLQTAMAQSEINSQSRVVFEMWDVLLNEVYQYLKGIMTEDEFKQLEKDELDWIKRKEDAIEEAAAEWEGGSGEPMVRYGVATTYTEERCYYLISLIDKY